MIWNQHNNLLGKHAFLSPSQYHWLNYNTDKLEQVYLNKQKMEEGTKLHALASELIKRGIKVAKYKKTFNMFVNDCIAFNMDSEIILYYSEFCFGTADAISYRDGKLKIFDLKTGSIKASFNQLDIYAALFCLEYAINPNDIWIEERIYQSNTFEERVADPNSISIIINKIIEFDNRLNEIVNKGINIA